MIARIKVATLVSTAKLRPKGYLEAVLSPPAIVADGWVSIPIHRYSALRERYSKNKPSLFQRLRGFLSEMIKWRQAGYRITPHRIFFERNKACAKCPYSVGKWIKTCGRCGCTRAKLWLETARCPEGRWKQ